MKDRPRHKNKNIKEALQYAESKGWRYKPSGNSAHAWGRIFCSLVDRNGCAMSVWSTPKSNENHARQIKRKVDACEHEQGEQNE